MNLLLSSIFNSGLLGVVPDAWVIGFQILNLLGTIILALVVLLLGAKQRRLEGLEAGLSSRTDQLIDAKFSALAGKLQGSIDTLSNSIQTISQRLCGSDEEIRDMLDGSHSLELRVAQQIGSLKDFIRENAASKDDLEKLEKRFESLQAAVARDAAERRRA